MCVDCAILTDEEKTKAAAACSPGFLKSGGTARLFPGKQSAVQAVHLAVICSRGQGHKIGSAVLWRWKGVVNMPP